MRWIGLLLVIVLSGCAALHPRVSRESASAASPSTAPVARTFGGWAAINGGGPHARISNDDWHTQNDLRVGVGAGHVPLHWRDGAPSGYSIELIELNYAERKLAVLQLNVIEDATGKPLTYVWADIKADAIGLNLGWLQVGLTLESTPPPVKPKS